MYKVVHPEFPDYFIRADGSVERRVDSKRYQKAGDILKGRILASGYRQHKLVSKDGLKKLIRANRLVCEAFHGSPPTPDHHAAHINGVRLDNRANNLYWATPKENCADRDRHGSSVRGERVSTAVLSDKIVASIRKEYDGARGSKTILARKYNASVHAISLAIAGETWRHVKTKASQPKRLWDRLSHAEKVEAVKFMAMHGVTRRKASEKLETSMDALCHFALKNNISFRSAKTFKAVFEPRRAA